MQIDHEAGVLAWHFRRADGTTGYLKTAEEVGRIYEVTGEITCCENGLHGSVCAIDALGYGPPDTALVCRTRHSGEMDRRDDKIASQFRVVLWQADCTAILHEFACRCAEQAFEDARKNGQVVDPRSLAAVGAKRAWLRGEISGEDLAAVLAAAWPAASTAARAAAWPAARSAARSAARAAACDAAKAAASTAASTAAWDAAWDAQNERLEAMLLMLAPKGEQE